MSIPVAYAICMKPAEMQILLLRGFMYTAADCNGAKARVPTRRRHGRAGPPRPMNMHMGGIMKYSMVTAHHFGLTGKLLMHRAAPLLLPLLILLPGVAYCGDNKTSKCMAEICLETPITQEDIVAKYGPGREYVRIDFVETEGPDHKLVRKPKPNPDLVKRCYYDPTQDLYIEFSFDKHQQRQVVYNSDLIEIVVTSVPMCPKKYKPKQPFQPFKTEHGISVGATEAEVLAAMGKPFDTISIADREQTMSKHESREELMREYDATEYGENGLYYSPDPGHNLLENLVYISQGKVKSILLGNSE